MKKYFSILFCFLFLAFARLSYAGNVTDVNEKVIKAFKQTFPFAEKVTWDEFSDRYIVHFEENDVRTVVDYDKDGNYLGSKRYYKENNLPVSILYKIRTKYADKKIFGVTEISTDTSIDYYVKMEDNSNWVTVKCDASGAMEVVEKYKKTE
ncbi:MAG: PepSY-like domain-containing protein [Bacteroidetes bacterium]|nr:PepSY-like domain-containing protein [Bacteroidota bacterium]MBS1934491.1 PepSY-like domain-containing protein [Bacteroidota bacterium]